MSSTLTGSSSVPYQLGAPIELADFLALPADGNRYTRDEEGRLALMGPDDADHHRLPIMRLARHLIRLLPDPCCVLQEGSIAFPRIYNLRGTFLRDSFFGPKAIAPDVAVFAHEPRSLRTPGGGTIIQPEGIRLVIEILSPTTWRSDLGLGRKDDVDRPRSYLESGVPEYWIINAGMDEPGCALKPYSGRFLERSPGGDDWYDLPLVEGRVRSRAVPEVELDLAALFSRSP